MINILKRTDKPYFWLILIFIPTAPLLIFFSNNFEYYSLIILFFVFEIIISVMLLPGPRIVYAASNNNDFIKIIKALLLVAMPFVIYPIYELIIGISGSGAATYLLESRVKMLEGQGSQFGYFMFFLLKLAAMLMLILTYFEYKLSLFAKFSIGVIIISHLSEGGRSFAFFLILAIFFIQMCKNDFPVKRLFIFGVATIILFSISMPIFRLDSPLTIDTFLTGVLWFFGYSIDGFLSFEDIYTNEINLYWKSLEGIVSSIGHDSWHEYLIDPYILVPGDIEINTFSAYGLYFNYFKYGIFIFLILKTFIISAFYKIRAKDPIFQLIYLLLLSSYPMIGLTDYFVDNLYFCLQLLILYTLLRFALKFKLGNFLKFATTKIGSLKETYH